jgi:hypothetical protein
MRHAEETNDCCSGGYDAAVEGRGEKFQDVVKTTFVITSVVK